MQLEFTDTEMELMRKLLDGEMRDLSVEIADTDNSRFRDELRAHRDALGALLDRFGGPLPDNES
jgi:hypothetical protein